MYCPECDRDPCLFLLNTSRTIEGYDRFILELAETRGST
jgi:hypothetical protein